MTVEAEKDFEDGTMVALKVEEGEMTKNIAPRR